MNDGPILYRRRELYPVVALDEAQPKTDPSGDEIPPAPAPPPMKSKSAFWPLSAASVDPEPESTRRSSGGRGQIGRGVRRATKRIREAAKYVGMILPARHPVPAIEGIPEGETINATLLEQIGETWWLHGGSCGQVHDLCRHTPVNRPFYHRPASWGGRLGCNATGFLLLEKGQKGERLVATTLHALACLSNPKEGGKNYIVFGFLDHPDNGWILRVGCVVEIERVYARGSSTADPSEDWALLEVAEKKLKECASDDSVRVGDRLDPEQGLEIHHELLDEDDKLVIVSHSLSMSKSWGRGQTIDIAHGTFSHDCDTLGGSSGAPLLKRDKSTNTLKVVGMCVRGGHLRSTPTGGAEPIPIGDPTEPFFGANIAVQFTKDRPPQKEKKQGDQASSSRAVAGSGAGQLSRAGGEECPPAAERPERVFLPSWPDYFPIEHKPPRHEKKKKVDPKRVELPLEAQEIGDLKPKDPKDPPKRIERSIRLVEDGKDYAFSLGRGELWELHWGKAIEVKATAADGGTVELIIRPW